MRACGKVGRCGAVRATLRRRFDDMELRWRRTGRKPTTWSTWGPRSRVLENLHWDPPPRRQA
eukprot:scaffold65673_cov48-Phaeocystis_antarctica.AAC.2